MKSKFKSIKAFAVLVCSLIALVSFGLGFNGMRRANAENVVPEIANANLNDLTGNMPTGWSTWKALNGKDESLANISFSTVKGDKAYEGASLKVINRSGDSMIRGVINSPEFEIEGGKTYLLSFYYRSDSDVTTSSLCVRQFKKNGDGTANTYLWVDAATVSGATGGYRLVSAPFTTDSNAAKAMLQLDIAPTGENAVYYDEFSLEKLDKLEFNGGFERVGNMETPLGWAMSNGSNFSFSDKIYYDGKTSAHIVREDYASAFTMTSLAKTDIRAAASYDIGFRMRSENSKGSKATITVSYYGTAGNIIATQTSPYVYLKNGEGLSDWTDVWIRYIAPQGSVAVGYTITISKGKTDCYIDGVYCRESGSVAYIEDFESISNEGIPDNYSAEPEMFTGGKLVLTGGKQAKTEIISLLYGNGYSVTGECVTEGGAKPVIEINWLDYNRKLLESKKFELKTTNNEFLAEFIEPQGTYAEIIYKNEGSGKVSFDNIRIDKTYDPKTAGSGWEAKWVCFPYADVAYGGQYMYAYYRKSFTLTEPVISAQIQLTGDDVITSYVNGTELNDEGKNAWASVLVAHIKDNLVVGKNTLAFRVYNQSYYGGVLFDLELTLESGKKMRVSSDNTVLSYNAGEKPLDGYDWNKTDFDDSAWKSSFVIGAPPCMPWGEIVYKQNAESLPKLTIKSAEVTEAVNAGETLEFTFNAHISEQITKDLTFKVNFRSKYVADEDEVMENWLVPALVSGKKTSEWVVGEDNIVTYRVEIPDYLTSDSYQLQFDTEEFKITNSRYAGNIIRGKYVAITSKEVVLTESHIEKENGRVQLIVNGEKVAPMMYLREQKTVFKTQYASGMYGADVDLMCLPNCRSYNMNSSGSMWTGYGEYDFTALDEVVYETLQGAPSAKLMLMLDADPPSWWFKKNPDAYAIDSKGKKAGISYASKKWREDVGVYYQALIAHVLAQPYAGHMFAVKISAGATFEWQTYGVTLSECADFGKDALKAFREWLKEKYVTNEALATAWGKKGVTFETASVPTYDERKAYTYETLLDGKAQRNVIDFHSFASDMTSDSVIYLAKTVKEAIDNKWIVGTYTGYLTHGLTYEANGLANAAIAKVIASPYVDFLCSPICYDERLLGMSASYMMMVDSLITAGKLPIIECDSRTVYFDSKTTSPALLGEWGKTYTLKDSVEALKRDFSNMMIKGAGLWWYDMYGGWFDDPEIYSMIKAAKAEWDKAIQKPVMSNSKIAYVIGDDIATTLAYSFDGTYHFLYEALYEQKESLGHIGTSYDMLYLSDIEDGFAREYDVYLILATNVTEKQKAAINKYLKKDGKTIIWVGAPGIYGSDGTMSVDYVSALTDITLAKAPTSYYGIRIVGNETYTKGLDGKLYGWINSTKVDPMFYVNDRAAETLGKIYNSDLTGLAVKAVETEDGGYYMSIYSAVGNIPEELLRNVLRICGVKLVESENDVVFRNSDYISVASPYGGVKTIEFNEKVDVYDVFKGEYVAKNVSKVEVTMEAGTTMLLRTEKPGSSKPDKPDKPDESASGSESGTSSGESHVKGGCNSAVAACSAVGILAAMSAATIFALKKRKKD